MGVPKFFRWLSERYPLINQRYYVPSSKLLEEGEGADKEGEDKEHNGKKSMSSILTNQDDKLKTATLAPEIDRLYIDTNGIIHGASHNNNGDDTSRISRQEIFDNITTYLDRIIGDVVQPKELVYIAIDGVAPRAKLNQQRSRRYQSTTGNEIEQTVYQAHQEALQQQRNERLTYDEDDDDHFQQRNYNQMDPGNTKKTTSSSDSATSKGHGQGLLKEVEPGRFTGKFETHLEGKEFMPDHDQQQHSDTNDNDYVDDTASQKFHSNQITPGTPFFQECTEHLEHYLKERLASDPKWQHLTVIFSGPNVPGEGEHKIMDFIRRQKTQKDYNPNLRHCIQGQDGDLIMLGLLTHEPNLVLLREQVIFDNQRRLQMESLGMEGYVHNPNFEFLHMNVLRDYLSYDFETSNVVAGSPFELEQTIDDFVFMTFFVGNDFLPAMPALDIADEAFDLLWYTYREHRERWYKEASSDNGNKPPYLTHAGNIVSGKRLEQFLSEVGSFEYAYYDNKKEESEIRNKSIRKADKLFGTASTYALPDDEVLQSKEQADRAKFREMMLAKQREEEEQTAAFTPVLSQSPSLSSDSTTTTQEEFQPDTQHNRLEPGLAQRLGTLLKQSVTTSSSSSLQGDERHSQQRHDTFDNSNSTDDMDDTPVVFDDQDLKGRYYYDKFQFTPYDAEKHRALRKAYIEGLVWNLKYYYEGCVSWSWYFPYHYGPMLSDLVEIDELLEEISFDGKMGEPLRPYEQLMACMPPSQAHYLPKPFRSLMTSPTSSIVDFYPQTFTVDMNGKRWPWEAVVLLPFIDSDRLLEATESITREQLTLEEQARNEFGQTRVMTAEGGMPLECSEWHCDTEGFQPEIKSGALIPLPGYPTLRAAPIRSLWRRRNGTNVFGNPTRYKTAVLEHSHAMPKLPPVESLAQSLIGTTVWINYPHLTEGFVTAVSNKEKSIRGKDAKVKKMNRKEQLAWSVRRDDLVEDLSKGHGVPGTGGLNVSPSQDVLLSVRPLQGLREMPDGTLAKVFSKYEIEVPVVTTLWAPVQSDPRLVNAPALLERDPYRVRQAKAGGKTKKKTLKSKGGKESTADKSVANTDSSSDSDEEESSLSSATTDRNTKQRKSAKKGRGSSLLPSLENEQPSREVPGSILPSNTLNFMGSKPKRNGQKHAGLFDDAEIDLMKTNLNGEKSGQKQERMSATRSGKAGGNFALFPATPSHEDVWKPINDDSENDDVTQVESSDVAPVVNGSAKWWELNGEQMHDHPHDNEPATTATLKATNSNKPPVMDEKPLKANTNAQWWKDADKSSRSFSTFTHQSHGQTMSARNLSSRLIAIPDNKFSRRLSTTVPRAAAANHTQITKTLRQGRGRIAAVGIAAATALYYASGAHASNPGLPVGNHRPVFGMRSSLSFSDCSFGSKRAFTPPWLLSLQGGDMPSRDPYASTHTQEGSLYGEDNDDTTTSSNVPPLEFLHGTTTLSFVFQGGAIVAVDSRASMGNFVSSKTTQKVLPINSHMLGTMAGGAADCSLLFRQLRSESMLFELQKGRRMSPCRVSKMLARTLYANRDKGLSVGTMIVGFDDNETLKTNTTRHDDNDDDSVVPRIYYVDNTGLRLQGKMFSAGSGSTFAYGILDTCHNHSMTEDEAVALGIRAIRYATFRDAFSGGFINVYVVTKKDGWKKVFTEDVAVTATLMDSDSK